MTDVDLVRALLAQLGVLTIMAGGFALMISAVVPPLRRWVGRLILLGLLFGTVAGFVTPEWLP